MPAPLLIRADGGARIGTGHLMRCFALAQAWARIDGGSVTLATAACPQFIEEKYLAAGFLVAKIGHGEIAPILAGSAPSWVVVDGYGFDDRVEGQLKEACGARMLALDDFGHATHAACDLVLNQNLGPVPVGYAAGGALCGTRYALLREEFMPWRKTGAPDRPLARSVLVTLGGADPGGRTGRLAEALTATRRAIPEIDCASGGADDMPARMAAADLVVAAGGSTVWELALLRRPTAVISLAPNQEANVRALVERGAAMELGADDAANADAILDLCADRRRRASLAERIGGLVDGFGAERVIDAMGHGRVRLRPATAADARQLHEWRSEPAVRAASFGQDEIPWDDHRRWLARKLGDRDRCLLCIAERPADGAALGQVRFEREGRAAEISISLDGAARGHGLAPWVIRMACDAAATAWPELREVVARIRPENAASFRAFASARFVRQDGRDDAMRLPVNDECPL